MAKRLARASGRRSSWKALFAVLLVAGSVVAFDPGIASSATNGGGQSSDYSPRAVHQDVSPPLRDIAPAREPNHERRERPQRGVPQPPLGTAPDPVIQASSPSAAAPAPSTSFEGIGQGFHGFSVLYAPPDTNGDVGPRNYVQIVNVDFAIFNKSGGLLYGPAPTNTVFAGFGGGCETNNDGDATVKYDRAADRWIISQFSVSTKPYLQCVAVSTGTEPTGSYYRYAFSYGNFPDYPKLGVWPDGYYETFNMFRNGVTFVGSEVCAYNRSAMLTGGAATQQCFTASSASLLPSDVDGPTAPPTGSPNFVMNFTTNALRLWRFHVDWVTPANSVFSGPTSIPVAAFSVPCSGGGACIPQPGTTQKLDSLADRLMYRLAYRNFGDHESLVVNHSVVAGSAVGVRWYEIRNPNGSPIVAQQGTWAPNDGNYRWMGSVAQDGSGDLAVGYSTSGTSTYPSIAYAGQTSADPVNTLGQGETILISGSGSQTSKSTSLDRWGDYSSMSIDPTDDCTFWYTTEYLTSNGVWNWHTRIGSFKFANCGGTQTPTPPSAPQSLTATAGNGSVQLSWSAPSSTGGAPIIYYNIYRGTSAGAEATTPIATATTSSYTDNNNVTNGTTYYYKVAAVNSAGEGPRSNEAFATPSASSTPLTASITKSCSGTTCTFDGSSSSGGQGPLNYSWTGDNGLTGSSVTVTHPYPNAVGTYSVTLTVTDSNSQTSQATTTVSCSSNGKSGNFKCQ